MSSVRQMRTCRKAYSGRWNADGVAQVLVLPGGWHSDCNGPLPFHQHKYKYHPLDYSVLCGSCILKAQSRCLLDVQALCVHFTNK